MRDEAHRFAQAYHHLVRRKRTFDEDAVPGTRSPRKPRKSDKPQIGSSPSAIGRDKAIVDLPTAAQLPTAPDSAGKSDAADP
jgi:hypothetical protein